MSAFVAAAALLLIATVAALILPLLRRRHSTAGQTLRASNARVYADQLADLDAELGAGNLTNEQWSERRGEIERRVLEDESADAPLAGSRAPRAAILIGVLVPVVAVGLYVWLGTPAALQPAGAGASGGAPTPHEVETMVQRLASKMAGDPGNTDGWIMLGRSYAVLGRFDDAAQAYAKAAEQRPQDVQTLTDYADVLGMANHGTLSGEPSTVIARALKLDPNNVKALALSGTAAFEAGRYRAAVDQWTKAVGLMEGDSEMKQSLQDGIAEATAKLQGGGGRESPGNAPRNAASDNLPAPAQNSAAQATPGKLTGRVVLAPAVAKLAKPEDTVYVYARATTGPRMPLAVLRHKVSELPFDFTLDDSMAMTPELKLSNFPRVVVVARISASGLATPQKGDLEAVSASLPHSSSGIALTISGPRN